MNNGEEEYRMYPIEIVKETKRHITNGNCSPPYSGGSASIRLGRLKAPTPHSGKLAAAVFASQSPNMPPPTS